MPYSASLTPRKPYHLAKRSQRPLLSEREAKAAALRILKERTLSTLAFDTINVLITAGVLTTMQLQAITHASVRSLRRYHFQHLLNHLYAPESLAHLPINPVDSSRLRLYTLGTLGLAIAQEQGKNVPSYAGYGSQQLAHDVLCNQVVLDLIQHGKARGYAATWYGKYETRVYGADTAKTRCVLEPDALLIFHKANAPKRAFLIEYHNEDHRNRTRDKVDRYEREVRNQFWREFWPLDDFPLVLAAFTHKVVADGYVEALGEVRGRGLQCRFLGKQFAVDDPHPALWWDFDRKKQMDIFA